MAVDVLAGALRTLAVDVLAEARIFALPAAGAFTDLKPAT